MAFFVRAEFLKRKEKKAQQDSTLSFTSIALMDFIIIGTDSFNFSSTPSEMNSANLFCRKSAGNEKCQDYFRETSDGGENELFGTIHLRDLDM